nr:PREDICTED: ras-related protein Rab-43 [Apteryx mantelli mantelli]
MDLPWMTNQIASYDEMTGSVDDGRAMDFVHCDFSKSFDMVSHSVLISKLWHYGPDGLATRWGKDCLDHWLQIWDTAGQERFRTITQSYYRSANGAILAYDISKRGSFQSIPRWIEDVRKYAGSNIVQLLIGNKSDLSDLREVQLEEAQSLAEHYDIICAIETSAKDSSNVEEAFVKMATELMMRHGGPMFSEKSTDSIKLDSKDIVEGWGCGC